LAIYQPKPNWLPKASNSRRASERKNVRYEKLGRGYCLVVEVVVRDNNVDQALRVLKKKMQREGIYREMKMRKHYEKPSEKRVRESAEAVRRARKLARKKGEFE
jgi:small subunit ribosomal protein S21